MSKKKIKKKELGKGIAALLSNMDSSPAPIKRAEVVKELTNNVASIPIDSVEVNPWQPRKRFQESELKELSDSIKIHGLIQPITVRRLTNNAFQLISGERRLRASKLAGLEEIPAYIRIANDQEMLEMALVENIQRSDLNAMEVAFTYQRLIDECQLTHEQLSQRVAKNRSSVTNYLRLLKLPPEIQSALKEKVITMGHARALAGVNDIMVQLDIFNRVVNNQLSVRVTEQLVKSHTSPGKASSSKSGSNQLPDEYRRVQDNLSQLLESKVQLKRNTKGKGQIVINFSNDKDLNRILDILENEDL